MLPTLSRHRAAWHFGAGGHATLDEADGLLTEALAVADTVGELVLRLRCISLLALNARRRHDAAAIAAPVPRALEPAEARSSPDYLAMAQEFLATSVRRPCRRQEQPRTATTARAPRRS